MPGDRHALDQGEGIAFHDHAVGERAGVALVGIADDVFLRRLGGHHGLPLDARREARAAAAPKAGIGDRLDDGGRGHLERLAQALQTAMRFVVLERQRIGDAAAGKCEPLLLGEIGDRFDQAQIELVRRAEAPVENGFHVCGRNRAVADAAGRRLDLEQRFEPQQAARAVAHQLGVELA